MISFLSIPLEPLVQYTYVLNNPLMYVDPLGETVIGIQIDCNVYLLLGFSGGAAVTADSEGNFTLYLTKGGGGGTSQFLLSLFTFKSFNVFFY